MFLFSSHQRLSWLPIAVAYLCAWMSQTGLRAEPKLEQLRSDNGQILVESPDVQLTSAVLATATDTRKRLAPLLGLPPTGTSYFYIRVLSAEPGKEWPQPYLAAMLRGDQLDFSIVLRVPGPRVTEEFARCVTLACLYEKIISNNTSFREGDSLPALPLWLSEGMFQVLLSGENRDWERVVSRAKKNHKAPTLETVLHWNELSSDSIERMWQQAFSYYLVSSLTRSGSPREAFQQWLLTADSDPAKAYTIPPSLMGDEFAWRAQLERSIDRSRDLIFSWEVSADELDKAMNITLPASGKKEEITTTIDALKSYKGHPELVETVKDKITQLTELQARSNIFWQPTLGYYNAALMSLINMRPPPKPAGATPSRGTKDFGNDNIPAKADYTDLITLARQARASNEKQHELLSDYLNWVVVTKAAGEQGSTFASYYELHRKLEDFRPGPKNTLGHNVLKIERAASTER